MQTTNLNAHPNRDIKKRTDKCSIPFPLKIDTPNQVTKAAIEEGLRIAADPNVKGYTNMTDLWKALES